MEADGAVSAVVLPVCVVVEGFRVEPKSEAHSHKGCRGWSLDVVVVALLATLSRTHCVTPSGTQRATLSGTDDQALSVTDSAQDAYSYR